MRLGMSSYACAWAIGIPGYPCPKPLTPEALLQLTHELGVNLVQIADNMPLHKLTDSDLVRLKSRADKLGIDIEVGTRGIEPSHLTRYIKVTQLLESDLLRLVVDTSTFRPEPNEIVAILRDVLPELENAGIRLAIENHDRFSVSTLAEIIHALGHPKIGVCLDTVNSFGSCEGPEKVVEVLGPIAINLHVKDFSISRLEHMMGFIILGTPAGKGALDIPGIISQLSRYGQDPNAILELWTPFQATIEETIDLERQWMFESVEYLKKTITVGDLQ